MITVYGITENEIQKATAMKIREAKANGIRNVYLNGWIESVNYVLTLSNIEWIGEEKSEDGYSMVQCYKQN
tara:strand:- start:1391 stop:1603 length:213 start_codon:yes stop_codon:yes gene_type:complete